MPTDPDIIYASISPNERLAYKYDVADRNDASAAVALSEAKLYDDRENDVTSTNMTGSGSASGNIITMPTVFGLTLGRRYEIQVLYTIGTNKYETVIILTCQKRGFV